MRIILQLALFFAASIACVQAQQSPIDLNHWKLELPSGYSASDWKLSNYQKDRFAKPFFHLDTIDSALVMEAYPTQGTSKAKYTRNTLREQMQPGSNDLNWTMKQGGALVAELQVTEMSKDASNNYHRTVLMQIDGRTTKKQTKQMGMEKPKSMPLIKIYWQNEKIYITRKVLKDEAMVGDALLMQDSWREGDGVYSQETIGFEKVRIQIEMKKNKISIQINDEKPIVYRDLSVSQWYFENYFTVGNYLQSKDENAKAIVKYYELAVSHEGKK